jgi:Tfp pilus assembly protein PilF
MKPSVLSIAFGALLSIPTAVLPADTTPAVQADPAIEQATKAVASKDWRQAQAVLKDAIARDPKNPDYHNLYAYSIRKGANPDMNLVFRHYNEALRLDPKHRGAHEYIGEAYLMVGNLPKAKEHLSSLDKLCFFPCSEFNDLKKSIAAYEAKGK